MIYIFLLLSQGFQYLFFYNGLISRIKQNNKFAILKEEEKKEMSIEMKMNYIRVLGESHELPLAITWLSG